MKLCLLVTSEAIPVNSYQFDYPNVSKDDTNEHTKVRGICHDGSTLDKNSRKQWKVVIGKDGHPKRKAYQLILQCHMVSYENIYTSKILWTQHLYLAIYMYIEIHICVQKQWKLRSSSWRRAENVIWEDVKEEMEERNLFLIWNKKQSQIDFNFKNFMYIYVYLYNNNNNIIIICIYLSCIHWLYYVHV